ncbi:uncharacterized protein G2W53_033661 [Senna tora]|uniref:Uncharacterized protein n=1 Tax=Senna tora TaxID=362788 RepID=A0A834T0Z3_9FABA|nr:uncharacterized protein G2W53_033661 [Senna tora]
MGGAWIMFQHIPDDKSRSDLRNLHELRCKRLVAQVSQTRRFALYSRTGVVLMLRLESSWHGRSVDHVSTYSGRQIAVGSHKPSRITRQKTCCASESNTSVRVVLANQSDFDAPIGVVFAWEERGSCLNLLQTRNRGRISETIMNYEAKDLLASESNTSSRLGMGGAWIMSQRIPDDKLRWDLRNLHELRGKRLVAHVSQTCRFAKLIGFDAPIGVVLAWEERESCLNIFRTTNHGRISKTFTNYEAKDLLRKSVKHVGSRTGVVLMLQLKSSSQGRSVDYVSTYSGRKIAVGSQKPSRITRQKSCCASESNKSVRVVFANQSGFDAAIGIVLAWEGRESCLNILRTTNRDRISETFTNYDPKDLLRNRHGMGGAWIMSPCIPDDKSRSDLRKLHELRGKRLVAQVSQTRRFALYSRNGVVLILQLESSGHGRSVDHVSTYSGRNIAVGSQKPSRIMRQKTRCASESNTSVRVVFENRSGFDAPIRFVFSWEERESCLNIFRTTNRGQISETFTNYEAKYLVRNRLGMGGAWIMSQHILDDKSRSDLRNLHELRGKRLVAQVSQTRRFALYSRTGVVLMLQLESSWHGRSVGHVSTYFGRQIAFGSQKPSRITRQKTCCARESNTSVRIVVANRSGFEAPNGVVLAWDERGSCLNIFRTTNRGQISESFTNYEAKDLLRKSVDHVSTYSGRQITVGSQKRSQITRQKTCWAIESNTSVRVVFANRSGFDAPIGVVLEWEEHGSCLNIFRMTNRGRISETFTNYEAKDLLRKRQIAVGSHKLSRIMRQKTCCANESNTSRGSCLNIFRTTNRGRISETFTNYEAKDLLRKRVKHVGSRTRVVLMLQLESSWHGRSVDHVSTYSGRQIPAESRKPSRITRQKTRCASESNTSVRVVFANRSGFDAPIGVVLAWEERGSCLNIFRRTNRGRISETFTNYEAKDSLRNPLGMGGAWIMSQRIPDDKSRTYLRNLHELRGKRLVAQVSQTRLFELYLRTGVVLMLQLELSWHGRSVDHVSTYCEREIAVGSQKTSRITRQKTCCASESNTSSRLGMGGAWIMSQRIPDDKLRSDLRNLHELRGKRLVAHVSQTCRFAKLIGFDAVIGVVLAWEDRGSCLNIFRMTNHGRISKTFTNYDAKDLSRKQKTCCASGSNKLVRIVFANRSGFDAPIGVVLEWEERGSCLNIFRTTNRGRISETFINYDAKDLLRKRVKHVDSRTRVVLMLQLELSWHGRSVDHVSTYSGRQITVGSQKPSRIMMQ